MGFFKGYAFAAGIGAANDLRRMRGTQAALLEAQQRTNLLLSMTEEQKAEFIAEEQRQQAEAARIAAAAEVARHSGPVLTRDVASLFTRTAAPAKPKDKREPLGTVLGKSLDNALHRNTGKDKRTQLKGW